MSIRVNELSKAIMEEMTNYNKEVTKVVKEVVDKVAEGTNEEIKRHITFKNRTGKYVQAFSLKTTYEDNNNKRVSWYVKPPHYRLTHLLEWGHATKNGGRTKAYPHTIYGYRYANENLVKEIKRGIENAK